MTGRSTASARGNSMETARRNVSIMVLAGQFLLAVCQASAAEQKSNAIDVTGFSSQTPELFFNDWKVRTAPSIPEHTVYRLIEDGQRSRVIEATAHASFAALSRELSVDPNLYRYIDWSWKVSGVAASADFSKKETDDAPVRLMVSFGRNLFKGGIPKRSLCYVWSSNDAVGTFIESPYTSDVMAVVVASGERNIGEWQQYRRNLVDDYRHAFGEDPGEIRAISLISDTDNTKAQVSAWYGAITLEAGTDRN